MKEDDDDDENDNLEYSFTLTSFPLLLPIYIYISIFCMCISCKDVIAFRKSDADEDEHTSHFINIRKMLERFQPLL